MPIDAALVGAPFKPSFQTVATLYHGLSVDYIRLVTY
jgi:hypothetical protein